MELASAQKAGAEVLDALGLAGRPIKWLRISFEAGQRPTVEFEEYVTDTAFKRVILVVRELEFVGKCEDVTTLADESRVFAPPQ